MCIVAMCIKGMCVLLMYIIIMCIVVRCTVDKAETLDELRRLVSAICHFPLGDLFNSVSDWILLDYLDFTLI